MAIKFHRELSEDERKEKELMDETAMEFIQKYGEIVTKRLGDTTSAKQQMYLISVFNQFLLTLISNKADIPLNELIQDLFSILTTSSAMMSELGEKLALSPKLDAAVYV